MNEHAQMDNWRQEVTYYDERRKLLSAGPELERCLMMLDRASMVVAAIVRFNAARENYRVGQS